MERTPVRYKLALAASVLVLLTIVIRHLQKVMQVRDSRGPPLVFRRFVKNDRNVIYTAPVPGTHSTVSVHAHEEPARMEEAMWDTTLNDLMQGWLGPVQGSSAIRVMRATGHSLDMDFVDTYMFEVVRMKPVTRGRT